MCVEYQVCKNQNSANYVVCGFSIPMLYQLSQCSKQPLEGIEPPPQPSAYKAVALPVVLRKQIECETEVMNLIKNRSSDAYT